MTSVAVPQRANIKEIAFRLRVSRQTVYNWRDAGCPIEEGIEAIKAWLAERRDDAGTDDELDRRLKLAEVLNEEEQARARKLANDIKEGHLLHADDVTQQVSELLLMVKHRLEAWPDQIVNEFPSDVRAVALERAKDVVFLLLTEMSQWRLDAGSS